MLKNSELLVLLQFVQFLDKLTDSIIQVWNFLFDYFDDDANLGKQILSQNFKEFWFVLELKIQEQSL